MKQINYLLLILCSLALPLQAQPFKGKVFDESDRQIRNKKITDVLEITFISKSEYLKQKENAVSFMPLSHNYQMQEEKEYYTLPCEECFNHTKKLSKHQYTDIVKYKYIGNILGQHLVSKNYYENVWTYQFIDVITGKKRLWFGEIPKVVNNQSRIFDIYSSPTNFSGISLKSIKYMDTKPKKFIQEFYIILEAWILNFKNPSNYFITKDNTIYAEVINEKIFSEVDWGGDDYNTRLKYIRLKQKITAGNTVYKQ